MTYAQKQKKRGLFHQHDDDFACVDSRGTRDGDLCGVSGGTSLLPRVQQLPKWEDSSIIPQKRERAHNGCGWVY